MEGFGFVRLTAKHASKFETHLGMYAHQPLVMLSVRQKESCQGQHVGWMTLRSACTLESADIKHLILASDPNSRF